MNIWVSSPGSKYSSSDLSVSFWDTTTIASRESRRKMEDERKRIYTVGGLRFKNRAVLSRTLYCEFTILTSTSQQIYIQYIQDRVYLK